MPRSRCITLLAALGSLWGLAAGLAAEENWLYPAEIAAWTDEIKQGQREAAAKLMAELKEAIARGDKNFAVAPGDYRFGSKETPNFKLEKVYGLTIDARGATFWFDGRQRIDGVMLVDCREVTLRGLTIDYDPYGSSQGEIKAIDPEDRSVEITIDPGFPLPDGWKTGGNIKAVIYGPDGHMRDVRMDWVKTLEKLEGKDGRTYKARFMHGWIFAYQTQVAVGDRLCLPDRSMRMAVNCNGAGNVLEDLTIYFAPHMAFSDVGGEGGNVYRRCRVIRRPGTRRLLACNADIFHAIKNVRGPIIEECEFSHAADDFINIHGFFMLVVEQNAPDRITVLGHYGDELVEGSELEFNRLETLEPLGTAKVKAVEHITDEKILAAIRAMPAEYRKQGGRMIDLHPKAFADIVTLDQPITVGKFDFISCLDRACRGAIIRNNYFHDGFVRGILSKSTDAVIENNRLERFGLPGIELASEAYWLEGLFPRNVRVTGNTLVECANMLTCRVPWGLHLGAISVFNEGGKQVCKYPLSSGLVIDGNQIVDSATCGISLINVGDSAVTNNTITRPGRRQPLEMGAEAGVRDSGDPSYGIFLASCRNVKIEGNTVTNLGPFSRGEIGFGPLVEACGPQLPAAPATDKK